MGESLLGVGLLLAFIAPEVFLVVIPALLITIYGVYEHGLPRHRKAAIAALVFLTAILLLYAVPLTFEIARWLSPAAAVGGG